MKISADGFISGLAAVTKDALDLSSSDVFLLAVCYEATRGAGGGGGAGKSKRKNSNDAKKVGKTNLSKEATDRLQKAKRSTVKALASLDRDKSGRDNTQQPKGGIGDGSHMINSESWKGGVVALRRQRLAATFAVHDTDRSGFLERDEIAQALRSSGFLMSQVSAGIFTHTAFQLLILVIFLK